MAAQNSTPADLARVRLQKTLAPDVLQDASNELSKADGVFAMLPYYLDDIKIDPAFAKALWSACSSVNRAHVMVEDASRRALENRQLESSLVSSLEVRSSAGVSWDGPRDYGNHYSI